MKRDENKTILTEVLSMRISKEEKRMLKNLQDKCYFDIFQFLRDTIRSEYAKRLDESGK